MKTKFKFEDANNNVFYIDVEIKTRNGKDCLSISGSYSGGGGQCYDAIKPLNKYQPRFIEIWKDYHLNDLNAGTVLQSKYIDEYFKEKQCDYTKAVKYLHSLSRKGDTVKPFTVMEFETQLSKEKEANDRIREFNSIADEIKKDLLSIKSNKTVGWVKVSNYFSDYYTHKVNLKKQADGNFYFFKNNISHYGSLEKQVLKRSDNILNGLKESASKINMNTLLYDFHPDTNKPYHYGSGWLTKPLPKTLEPELIKLIEKIDLPDLEPDAASQFLKDTGTSIEIAFKEHGLYFHEDKETRDIYNVTLKNDQSDYTFTFGQSIAQKNKKPDNYSVLACLNSYIPNTFEDFCSEFGYDSDSISALNIYEKLEEQSIALNELYNTQELEQLADIN